MPNENQGVKQRIWHDLGDGVQQWPKKTHVLLYHKTFPPDHVEEKTKSAENTEGKEAVDSSSLLKTHCDQLVLFPGFLPSPEVFKL